MIPAVDRWETFADRWADSCIDSANQRCAHHPRHAADDDDAAEPWIESRAGFQQACSDRGWLYFGAKWVQQRSNVDTSCWTGWLVVEPLSRMPHPGWGANKAKKLANSQQLVLPFFFCYLQISNKKCLNSTQVFNTHLLIHKGKWYSKSLIMFKASSCFKWSAE